MKEWSPFQGKKWQPGTVRRKMFERQQGRCCYCKRKMIPPCASNMNWGRKATVEHLQPKSQGGADHPSNYALACFKCNNERSKTNMSWLEFATMIEDRRAA